jgi:hypothetical protein
MSVCPPATISSVIIITISIFLLCSLCLRCPFLLLVLRVFLDMSVCLCCARASIRLPLTEISNTVSRCHTHARAHARARSAATAEKHHESRFTAVLRTGAPQHRRCCVCWRRELLTSAQASTGGSAQDTVCAFVSYHASTPSWRWCRPQVISTFAFVPCTDGASGALSDKRQLWMKQKKKTAADRCACGRGMPLGNMIHASVAIVNKCIHRARCACGRGMSLSNMIRTSAAIVNKCTHHRACCFPTAYRCGQCRCSTELC